MDEALRQRSWTGAEPDSKSREVLHEVFAPYAGE